MENKTTPLVLLVHGIGVSAQSFCAVQKLMHKSGYQTETFDWTQQSARYSWDGYTMTDLRGALSVTLDRLHQSNRSIVVVGHSAGCFVAADALKHPGVSAQLHLALPPWGPYIKFGLTTNTDLETPTIPAARSMQIALQALRGDMVEFTAAEQVAYGADPNHISGSIFVPGSILRGFALPGYYLPRNNTGKPALVHVSQRDHVIAPQWRSTWGLGQWGYQRMPGWNTMTHCSYTTFSTDMVRFWRHIAHETLPGLQDARASHSDVSCIALPALPGNSQLAV